MNSSISLKRKNNGLTFKTIILACVMLIGFNFNSASAAASNYTINSGTFSSVLAMKGSVNVDSSLWYGLTFSASEKAVYSVYVQRKSWTGSWVTVKEAIWVGSYSRQSAVKKYTGLQSGTYRLLFESANGYSVTVSGGVTGS